MLAQIAQIVSVVQILQLRGVASEFLVVGADGARVLHPAVDHFLFLIALILKLNWDNNSHREYGHERDNEKQREQDISLFLSTTVPATSAGCISTLAL